jgi:predicted nuclease of predicted toxin-antitoxin system
MKILTDENVESTIVNWLISEGHDFLQVGSAFPSIDDESIIKIAVTEKRILITNDKDFGELVFRQNKLSNGIILIRAADEHADNKLEKIQKLLNAVTPEKIENSFIVLNEQGSRIRRL